MDYSQIHNDPDNPAAASPWQTSPQAPSRTSYSRDGGANSPTLAASSPYGDQSSRPSHEAGDDEETLGGESVDYTESEPDSTARENGSSPDLSTRLQSPPLIEQGFLPQQQYIGQQRQASYQQQPGQQPRPTAPGRYQSGQQRPPRQNPPRYKLQAKITGLERTGRKDPILKFDVHVGAQDSFLSNCTY